MLVDVPTIDWLTLVTFNRASWSSVQLAWQSFLESSGAAYGLKKGKVMQYQGNVIGDVFFGAAVQRGQEHFMVRASGDVAYTLFAKVRLTGLKCTRVDVQVTTEIPEGYSALTLYQQLEGATWKGKDPKLSLIKNRDGMDTVYIGSRKSEKLIRVYVKQSADGERFVRFEIEYKGVRAESLMVAMLNDFGAAVSGVMRETMGRIAESVSMMDSFRSVLAVYDPMSLRGRYVRPNDKTMDWLTGQVDTSIRRMMRSHEHSTAVASWLYSLIEEWEKIQ